MIGRYEAYMDGVSLSSINNAIVITDISHKSANIQQKTAKTANRNGSRIIGSYTDSTPVSISFMIREYDTIKRQEICQKVAQWAVHGSYLAVYDRPWQKLRCVCEQIPSIDSAKNWTDEIQMSFRGINPPYWQEENSTSITLGGSSGATSGSAFAYIPGNAKDDLVSVTITAKASISTLSLTAGSKTLSFSGFSLSTDDVMTIDYDDDLNIRIRKGSTSLMSKRTASSADDLLVDCGKSNQFSFTSSGNAVVTFNVRGWWY